MKAKYLIKEIIKSISGIEIVYKPKKNQGLTCNARYCYSVWLRHLIYAFQNGFNSVPNIIAELGPGDSLGVGISALVSGAEKYFALDVIEHCSLKVNLQIFEDIVALFQQRTAVPDENEFPRVYPNLEKYDFPIEIFSDDYLDQVLNKNRLLKIKESIISLKSSKTINKNNMISYVVPWDESSLIQQHSLDMIISQAVLQHVHDLTLTYKCMNNWLKPKGLISHQIDFTSVGFSDNWYGHWQYSDFEWKIIKGKKNYYINREPHSTHIKLLNANNFQLVFDLKTFSKESVDKKKLARRFKIFPEEDFSITGSFIQATK